MIGGGAGSRYAHVHHRHLGLRRLGPHMAPHLQIVVVGTEGFQEGSPEVEKVVGVCVIVGVVAVVSVEALLGLLAAVGAGRRVTQPGIRCPVELSESLE